MNPPPIRPSWVQQTLLPPEAVEITLRVGIVGAADHCQWQLEARNATDNTLLAMRSVPSTTTSRIELELELLQPQLLELVRAFLVPF